EDFQPERAACLRCRLLKAVWRRMRGRIVAEPVKESVRTNRIELDFASLDVLLQDRRRDAAALEIVEHAVERVTRLHALHVFAAARIQIAALHPRAVRAERVAEAAAQRPRRRDDARRRP